MQLFSLHVQWPQKFQIMWHHAPQKNYGNIMYSDKVHFHFSRIQPEYIIRVHTSSLWLNKCTSLPSWCSVSVFLAMVLASCYSRLYCMISSNWHIWPWGDSFFFLSFFLPSSHSHTPKWNNFVLRLQSVAIDSTVRHNDPPTDGRTDRWIFFFFGTLRKKVLLDLGHFFQ